MIQFTNSIRQSLHDGNWFGALFIALALPDICGAISEPKLGVGERYRNWFNSYLKEKYNPDTMYDAISMNCPEALPQFSTEDIEYFKRTKPNIFFSAQACYKIRCSCLHAGVDFSNEQSVVFTPADRNGSGSHMNMWNGTLQMNVGRFCEDMCLAVDKWLRDNENNDVIMKRVGELMQIHNIIFNGAMLVR